MASKRPTDMVLPGTSLMMDGYLGNVSMVTDYDLHSNLFGGPEKMAFMDNNDVTSEKTDGKTRLKKTTSMLNDYNSLYNGLMIIPWDDFVENPRKLNDLFHLEKTGFITFDTDEVNVFFHATRMNKPILGDVSENGKSWVIHVKNIREFENIRASLVEKISVFGLTLVKKDGRFGKSNRAPCLLMLDPHHGTIGEQIHNHITRCIHLMENKMNFCLKICFNGSVERWCRRITTSDCRSVGARLIITNGEEADNVDTAENVVCCIVCFPIWAIQTAIYKAYRSITYIDTDLDFKAEEVLLHGSIGGVQSQRVKLFKDRVKNGVFYTTPTEHSPDDQGHKYICIKKYDKSGEDTTIEQYRTTSMCNLFADKHDKLLKKSLKKDNRSISSTDLRQFKLESRNIHKDDAENSQTKTTKESSSTASGSLTGLSRPKMEKLIAAVAVENNDSVNLTEAKSASKDVQAEDDVEDSKDSVVELVPRKSNSNVMVEDTIEEEEISSVQIIGPARLNHSIKQQQREGTDNLAFESDDEIDQESRIETPLNENHIHNNIVSRLISTESTGKSIRTKNTSHVENRHLPVESKEATDSLRNRMVERQISHEVEDTKESGKNNVKDEQIHSLRRKNTIPSDNSGTLLPPIGGKLPPLNNSTQNIKAEMDQDVLFEPNLKFKHKRDLSQGFIDKTEVDKIIQDAENNIIAVNKTNLTFEVDTTELEQTDMETDLDLSDIESEEEPTKANENPFSRTSSTEGNVTLNKRPSSSSRRKAAYDSRRRYLAVQLPKKHVTCSKPDVPTGKTLVNNELS